MSKMKKEVRPYEIIIKTEAGSQSVVVYTDSLAVQSFEPLAHNNPLPDKEYQLKAHGRPVFRCLMRDVLCVIDLKNNALEDVDYQQAIANVQPKMKV